MALQKQNVNIPFAKGLDTKTDDKQVVPGKFLILENAIFTSPGKFKKRNGYVALTKLIEGGSSSISSGVALANFKNELALLDGTKIYSYSESTAKWSDKGKATSVEVTSKPIIRNTYQQVTGDAAQHSSGVQVFTWEDSRGTARYSVFDSITGEAIVADQALEAGSEKPKPFALGNRIVIIFYNSISNHLRMTSIPIAAPSTLTTPVDIALNMNPTNPNFDASLSNTELYVAYNTSAGGGAIAIRRINSFLTVSSARNVVGESASSCIALTIDLILNQVWVAYHNGTEIKYFIYDNLLNAIAILNPTLVSANSNTINNITLLASNGSGETFYTQNAAATYNNFIIKAPLTNAGVVGSVSTLILGMGIAAKPFYYNDLSYIVIAFDTDLQPTYFIIETSDARAIAKFSPAIGGGLLVKNIVPEVVGLGNGQFLIPSLQKSLLTSVAGAVYTQTGVISSIVNFEAFGPFDKVELAQNLHLTGGFLSMYDGISVVEHNYHIYPENISVATATGSGDLTAGSYQYVVVYEWTDNQGQTHLSAPSVPVTQLTTTANSTNTLTIPTLRITDKKSPLRSDVIIGVYRTEVDGTNFYKCSSITSPLFNDVNVDTVTFIDTMSNTTLIGNQTLYTTGGVLDNSAAPACNFVTTYKDRIILLPTETPNQWWPSKQIINGVPVEFSEALAQNVDQAGGNLVAAARLDSALILLKDKSIYAITGQGPDNTGAQNDWGQAQSIVSDGGCIDKNSVILTTAGLMYKSQKGIYLLERSLASKYIGADVEAFNSSRIVSANLIDNTQQVRFCLDSGVALVYDYYVGEWSVFTKHDAVDSVMFQGEFTYLQSNGLVLQETPNQYRDNGEFIKLKLRTSWLSMAGIDSFQRVYQMLILGTYINPHNLIVSVGYDFNPYPTQESVVLVGSLLETPVYGADSVYGESSPYGGEFPLYLFSISLSQQKCTAIQFTMEDTPTGTDFGQNLSLSSFTLEVGAKKGLDKVPAKKSV